MSIVIKIRILYSLSRFSEEYEELKHVGRDKPCVAADIPVNRPKNRYCSNLFSSNAIFNSVTKSFFNISDSPIFFRTTTPA